MANVGSTRVGTSARPVRVISFFSGLGAADLALREASRRTGIVTQTVLALDSWDAAVRVFNANIPDGEARVGDVKALQPDDLPPHDLIIGGPPCQPWSNAGARGREDDDRDCVPDFVRLTRGGRTPFLMENVVGGLLDGFRLPAIFEACLSAGDYGDATSRRRHWYTNLGGIVSSDAPSLFEDPRDLVVLPTADKRRVRDIRDASADAPYSGATQPPLIALRQNSGRPPDLYDDDDLLGTLLWNAWHAASVREMNEAVSLWPLHAAEPRRLARCPSILEMARAHSLPAEWSWAGATKSDQGRMVANSWPVALGAAVLAGALRSLVIGNRLEVAA